MSEADQVETAKTSGLDQLRAYLQHGKLWALTDLRAWLVVFVGPLAQVVMAVAT